MIKCLIKKQPVEPRLSSSLLGLLSDLKMISIIRGSLAINNRYISKTHVEMN